MTGLLHRAANRLVREIDLAVVRRSGRFDWPHQQFIKRFLDQAEIDCVLDVGANIGQFAREVRRLGYKGLILSFEPDPTAFAKLVSASGADPLWRCFDIALGSAPATGQFNIMRESLFNSFHTPTTRDTERYRSLNTIVETVPVRVDTLNGLFPALQAEFDFKRPYLKMDTQGHDLEVFRGASAVRDRIRALQSELSVKKIYEGSTDWREAIAEYEQAGFQLAGLFQVNPGGAELVELDCHMIRTT